MFKMSISFFIYKIKLWLSYKQSFDYCFSYRDMLYYNHTGDNDFKEAILCN